MNKKTLGFLDEKELDLYILTKSAIILSKKGGVGRCFCEYDYRKNDTFFILYVKSAMLCGRKWVRSI